MSPTTVSAPLPALPGLSAPATDGPTATAERHRRPPPSHPTLPEILATALALRGHVLQTPVWHWQAGAVPARLAPGTQLWLKMELWQHTGSFKLRGALANLLALDRAERARGVVAASAGNHALTVAQAAAMLGLPAVVVMPHTADPVRIAGCRSAGARVLLEDSMHTAFATALQLAAGEGSTLVHPYDGHRTALGTATVGLELAEQAGPLDAVVVPVGGGGLIGGVAAAIKQLQPRCRVYGVEPEGADVMARSFEAGAPAVLPRVASVADSLGAPQALPYSYGVCRRFVDDIVRVDDDALCAAMHHLYTDLKLAVEPAAAAATAALLGPLRARLAGQRVGLILCGTNQDAARYAPLLARGAALAAA